MNRLINAKEGKARGNEYEISKLLSVDEVILFSGVHLQHV